MTPGSHVAPEADLSAYVLKSLDEHIAAMQRLRALMRPRTTTRPGTRYLLALDSIRTAQEYSGRLMTALLPPTAQPRPTAGRGRARPTRPTRPTPTRDGAGRKGVYDILEGDGYDVAVAEHTLVRVRPPSRRSGGDA